MKKLNKLVTNISTNIYIIIKMSYTRSIYQKKCSACAETKMGACSRHFFMFMSDSKTEELYCKNMFSFTAGTLLNDTIFLYIYTHRLINVKCPSHHCKNLGSPIKNYLLLIKVLHGDEFVFMSNSLRV